MAPYEEHFFYSCEKQKWDEVQHMIRARPNLLWTARDGLLHTAAHIFVLHDNVEMLQFMFSTISSMDVSPEYRKRLLSNSYEKGNLFRVTAYHMAAAKGHVSCLAFLVQHCPSGINILTREDHYGQTVVHRAINADQMEILEFIATVSPQGMKALDVKTQYGVKLITTGMQKHFTDQVVQRIGLTRELLAVDATVANFEYETLPGLMFHVIMQDINVRLYRLNKWTS